MDGRILFLRDVVNERFPMDTSGRREREMRFERKGNEVLLALSAEELKLLRRALERASFVDTPVSEQAEIAAFCEAALDALPDR